MRPIAIGLVLLAAASGGGCAGLPSLGGGDPALYAMLDPASTATAAATVQTGLERNQDGVTASWAEPGAGTAGSVTPLRTYLTDRGHVCRDYEERLAVGGRTGAFRHTACRAADGRWVWI
jgi:surface antigen